MDYNEICFSYTTLLNTVNDIADKLDEAYNKLYQLEDEHKDAEAESQRDKCEQLNEDYEEMGAVLDRLFAVRSSMELYMDACTLYANSLEKYGFYD